MRSLNSTASDSILIFQDVCCDGVEDEEEDHIESLETSSQNENAEETKVCFLRFLLLGDGHTGRVLSFSQTFLSFGAFNH